MYQESKHAYGLTDAISALQAGDHINAIRTLERAVALNPTSFDTRRMLGVAYGVAGEQDKSAKILSDVLPSNPVRAQEEIRKFVFRAIHQSDMWQGGGSVSGPGSVLGQTVSIRGEINCLIRKLSVRAVLDAPCGDFTWMKSVDLGSACYTGVDIVPEIVRENEERFGGENYSFLNLDIVKDELPVADLVLCRDCLVHLSLFDGMMTIANFRRSGARYLLATTFPSVKQNEDVLVAGPWRPLNLELAPFSLGEPLLLINEFCTENSVYAPDKSLGLWRLN